MSRKSPPARLRTTSAYPSDPLHDHLTTNQLTTYPLNLRIRAGVRP